MADSGLQENAEKLQGLIRNEKVTYKQVYDLLDKKPTILTYFGAINNSNYIVTPPLKTAIMHNNLQAAEAILDIMATHKDAILDALTQAGQLKNGVLDGSHALNHPFYMNYGDDSPVELVRSPEMVRLLHSKNYDFNPQIGPFYQGQLLQLYQDISERIPSAQELSKKKKILRAALDNHIPGSEKLAEITYRELSWHRRCEGVLVEQKAEQYQAFAGDVMEMLARLGVNCRSIPEQDREAAGVDFSAQVKISIKNSLEIFAKKAAATYLTEKNPEEKQELLRATCACGKLPELLSTCLKTDTQAAITLIDALDPEWEKAYQAEIRLARAQLARTVAAKPTAFTDYVRSGASSFSGKV